MLGKIIKNIALILDDQQTLKNLSEIENNPEIQMSTSTQTYITLVNFVLTNIAENFLCYSCTQEFVSDLNCKIELVDFRYTPCNIKHVKNESFRNTKFYVSLDHIYVDNPNRVYFVEYCFVPPDLTNLTDTVMLPIGLDYKAICYAVVSEYYASKLQFTEANIWELKYKQCLKNLNRTYKDIRFASGRWF